MMKPSALDKVNSEEPEMFGPSALEVFDNAFDLYGRLDREGHILDLRGSIFEETSAEPQLQISQRFPDTIFWQSSEHNPKLIEKAIASAIKNGKSEITVDFRISADERRPLELMLMRMDDSLFVCARQIQVAGTTGLNIRNESEQLLLAAENADIGLWFWDDADDRMYSTPRCNELFELPAYDELTYEKFIAAVHPDDREFVNNFFDETRRKGTKYEEEFRVVSSDGTIEWLCAEGRSFLNDDGTPKKMVGVIRRITAEKEASAELERVYERERKARDEAEIANKGKDFFLAFVSHELRSPLNAIIGWANILRRDISEETRKKALDTIENSAHIQTKLINDLVDSVRVATGRLKLECRPVNLVNIVKSTFEAQRPFAESHDLKYSLNSDAEKVIVFGDPGRLHQVFANLISNALRYTPPNGEVAVSIESTGETASIRVSDNGIGIDPKVLPKIFQQFSQGNPENVRRSGGLGLGLSIVEILVGKHGGAVTAESGGLGLGSRFTVTLPLSDPSHASEPVSVNPADPERKRLEGIRVMIVEDDPDSREVLQIFLEQNGASVRTADSARSGMAAFLDETSPVPDVLISDLAMPEEDGYTFITRIRELPKEKGGHVPALALSAFASAESRQRAFQSGFHRYLTKPFEPDSIVDQILALRDLNGGSDQQPV